MKINLESKSMIESFRNGEKRGFMYFFHLFHKSLVYYIFLIVDDKYIAEDIVEEAYVKLFERRENFFMGSKIKSWLYACCRNASFDYIRNKRKLESVTKDLTVLTEGDCVPDTSDLIIRSEAMAMLHEALNKLPARGRQVIFLLFFDNKSISEVAEIMKTSIQTVKNQRARCIKIMNKLLTPA